MMNRFQGWMVWAVSMGLAGVTMCAQQSPISVKRMNGQSIVPVFEGWERNSDGTFNLVFGYLNRNYAEAISLPVGQENQFDSGTADRGQPTYFYPRRHAFLFRTKVEKDWGEKELVWALTVNGRTEKAYGSLKPVWELSQSVIVDNVHGNVNINFAEQDHPPSLTINPVQSRLALHTPLTLTATATDTDGIPPPEKSRVRGAVAGRTGETSEAPLFMNVPFVPSQRFPAGLSAGWIVYRGPVDAEFEPDGYHVVSPTGTFVTKVRFSQPGTYVLRAVASDSMLETTADVTVTVATSR
jgi:hypothetical protein